VSAAKAMTENSERIRIKVEPSQSVLHAGEEAKAYLRVNLEGVPYESEGQRPPVNLALVIDRSGSMTGPKIEQAKEAAILALSRLSPADRISVIAFDNNVNVIVPSGPFEDFDEMRRRIEALGPGGSTAIYAAVRQAANGVIEGARPDRVSRIILLSDGQANVGPSSPADLERLGREIGGEGVTVTTIGLGLGYSEDLMTRLAYASDGNHAFVERPEQLADIFNKEFGDVLSIVGQDVEIIIECPDGVKPLRALGRDVKIEGRRISYKLNQLGGAQQRYLLIELDVDGKAAKSTSALADVSIAYTDPKTKQRVNLKSKADITFSVSAEEAAKSVNASVAGAVAAQLANERSEEAVKLRDQGKIAEAKKALESNAAYLREEADKLHALSPSAASPLMDMARRNDQDAAKVGSEAEWNSTRKSMKADQYRAKTQQAY
jgi:Ca-activated chloride channel family protein